MEPDLTAQKQPVPDLHNIDQPSEEYTVGEEPAGFYHPLRTMLSIPRIYPSLQQPQQPQ